MIDGPMVAQFERHVVLKSASLAHSFDWPRRCICFLLFEVFEQCANTWCRAKVEGLGPDPLREDADAERLWNSIQNSKKPIGLVLMDQTLVAGLGNIYRAEVLFKVRGAELLGQTPC